MSNDYEDINLEELNNKGIKKAYFTEKILNISIYLSIIPSITYNAIFLFLVLKNDMLILKNLQIGQCEELMSWSDVVMWWTIIGFLKSSIFLCCICKNREHNSNEYDYNFTCLLLKAITSYIPAIYLNSKLGSIVLNKYNNEYCNVLQDIVLNFQYFEYCYVVFFTTLLVSVPGLGILACCKELWKSR